MNDTLLEALKEAYALAPAGVVYLETLTIAHPAIPGETVYLVKDMQGHTFTLEDASEHDFEPAGFRVSLPPSGDNGLQELSIGIDNVDQRISDFLNKAKDYQVPVTLTYRPYLSTDLTTPQMDPPLVLNLTDIVVTDVEVTGRATFADIINKSFPSVMYTRKHFPGLANF